MIDLKTIKFIKITSWSITRLTKQCSLTKDQFYGLFIILKNQKKYRLMKQMMNICSFVLVVKIFYVNPCLLQKVLENHALVVNPMNCVIMNNVTYVMKKQLQQC